MGTFTSNVKFYKPDPSEFVDVDAHLNVNWQIADKQVRRLLEYEFSTASTPDVFNAIERSRYFKHYSNSVMAYFPSQGFFYQDPYSYVSTWNKAGSLLASGYTEHPDYPVGWRIIRNVNSPTTAEIEWTGAFWIGGGVITNNTNVTVIANLPSLTVPVVSKYFTMNAGNTTANYSIARVGFFSGSPGTLQYKRYGDAGNSTDENRIDLNGIKYNVEVAA